MASMRFMTLDSLPSVCDAVLRTDLPSGGSAQPPVVLRTDLPSGGSAQPPVVLRTDLPSGGSAQPPHVSLSRNITITSSPPEGRTQNGAAPDEQLQVFVNITNTGSTPLILSDMHALLHVSLAVQAYNGSWSIQPSTSFQLQCWGMYISSSASVQSVAYSANLCGGGGISAVLNDMGVIDIAVVSTTTNNSSTPLLLCPGCSLTGPPDGSPALTLQHRSYGRLDFATTSGGATDRAAIVLPLACGTSAADVVASTQALSANPGVERHPSCQPWTTVKTMTALPTCTSSFAGLKVKLATSRGAGGSELRLRPTLTNAGAMPAPLFGASFGILLSSALADDDITMAADIVRPPTEWTVDCWYGVTRTPDGAALYGSISPCEWMSAQMTTSPIPGTVLLNVTFLGGELCAGCTIGAGSAGTDDALVNVKHVSYAAMGVVPSPRLQPGSHSGGVTCAAPSAPPARCVSSNSA